MSASKCSSRDETLGNDFVTCSAEGCVLHFACAGVTESGWRKNRNKNNWRCQPSCKTNNADDKADDLKTFMKRMEGKMNEFDDYENNIQ